MTRSEAARLLGVRVDADPAAVRGAFRTLARRAHPDASDGGNPALLAAAKDARDILLGSLRPDPEPVPEPRVMAQPVPGGVARPAGAYASAPRPQMEEVRERRLGRFLGFVAFLVLLVVGAVLAVLLIFVDTAQDLAPFVQRDLVRVPASSGEADNDSRPQTDGSECVIVTLVPAEVRGVDCAEPDAQRVVAVFGGRVDCVLNLNALFVAGQTWCLQPSDQIEDSILPPEAGG